ncbi:MAG TPA: TonB-dependent receptor [Chitinophagaceae bacterium]|nr:TonB-dependent receptor [Chitinophagaceae bacterium]
MNTEIFAVTAVFVRSQLEAQTSEEDSAKSLDNVVITAAKYPTKQSNTGKLVSVITHDQIEKSVGKDLAQLLNEQTGLVVIGAFSNPGKDKSIFLRGASSNYTLILLDGIPLNDPSGSGGTFDIRLIPVEQIERIEILKGSQSTLYGSNAIAGVINIISKTPGTNQLAGDGLLSYGSYHSFKANANVNRKSKLLEYNLNYEYFDTRGISEAKDTSGNGNFDKDGLNRQSFQAILGFNITRNIKFSPFYRFSQFNGKYDSGPFTDGSEKYKARLVNTGFIGTFGYGKGTVTMNYGYDFTDLSYTGYLLGGKFNHGEAYVNHNFNEHFKLLAGLNYQTFRLPEPDTTNSIFSSYASLIYHQSSFTMELGSRYNKHNRYGDNFTYSVNPSYLLNQRVKIFVDVSSGYRAPSITELFGPFGANSNLKPEVSNTMEGGIQGWWLNKKLSTLATWFQRDITDVIVYEYPIGYINRDRQKDHGRELEVRFIPDNRWNLRASYAFVEGKLTQKLGGKDTTFNNLIRRPRHSFDLFAGYQVTKKLFISTSLQYFSNRNDIYYNPNNFYAPEQKVLKSYILWNAYSEYKLPNNSAVIFVDCKNVNNNKDYQEVYGYNEQGFTFNGGLRFRL